MLSGLRAWVTAIRREQTPARARAGVVKRDAKFGLVKINPLAAWSARDVWEYIVKHDVLVRTHEESAVTSADRIIFELERRRLLPARLGAEELALPGVSDEHEHRTDL